jgi:hypothetical protein
VADLRDGSLANVQGFGTDEGLPPLWAFLHGDEPATAGTRDAAA